MKSSRVLPGLLLVASLASVCPGAAACTVTICDDSRQLFQGAKLVYQGYPEEDGQTFQVSHTWRGNPRNTVVVHPTHTFFDPCSCGGAIEGGVGKEYLLVIYCDESTPDSDDVFGCDAYVEPVSQADDRLRFLEAGRILNPDELEATLEAWAGSDTQMCEIERWTREMNVLADVDDWMAIEIEGDVMDFSPTATVLTALSGFFWHSPSCDQAPQRITDTLSRGVFPQLIGLLRGNIPENETYWESLEDQLDDIKDD